LSRSNTCSKKEVGSVMRPVRVAAPNKLRQH
jgi:hypothetical protein